MELAEVSACDQRVEHASCDDKWSYMGGDNISTLYTADWEHSQHPKAFINPVNMNQLNDSSCGIYLDVSLATTIKMKNHITSLLLYTMSMLQQMTD